MKVEGKRYTEREIEDGRRSVEEIRFYTILVVGARRLKVTDTLMVMIVRYKIEAVV